MKRHVRQATARTRLFIALELIVVVSVVRATGFHFIEIWPWFDRMRMTRVR